MVLNINTIFNFIKIDKSSDEFEVTCSYLEVYNEVIYDLLEKSSGHLELREDPEQGIIVVGLRCIKVKHLSGVLSREGRVYTFSWGNETKLGHQTDPTDLGALENIPVVQITAK
ncbi:hypothetical protein L6452_09154 [Arctium lappa]|uniref:Uncharacterized protein n=1 Tax=Arctium lappa TaxID=4217 RepID=A0ACB9DJL4_ARCLA|nr:hypothetical protein L6452_09154 [Arctium lappa]